MNISLNIRRALICLVLGSVIFSCNTSKSIYMYRLKLNTDQYDSLKAYNGKELRLQFFYPKTKKLQSPTLFAYAMESANQSLHKPPAQLAYDSVSKEPFTGRAQVLSDQHILNSSLDSLLAETGGGYQGKNLYFLFTPKFHAENPHIYYEVKLAGSDGLSKRTISTNPCPPCRTQVK